MANESSILIVILVILLLTRIWQWILICHSCRHRLQDLPRILTSISSRLLLGDGLWADVATATILCWQWSTKSRSRTDLIMASSFGVSGVVTALVGEGRLLVAVSTRRVDFILMGSSFELLFYFGLICSFILWRQHSLVAQQAGRHHSLFDHFHRHRRKWELIAKLSSRSRTCRT